MPYVEKSKRSVIDVGPVNNVGQLTYVFYFVAKEYNKSGEESYARHAEVIAALDNAKEEYRRRFLNPYEDAKREENGDV